MLRRLSSQKEYKFIWIFKLSMLFHRTVLADGRQGASTPKSRLEILSRKEDHSELSYKVNDQRLLVNAFLPFIHLTLKRTPWSSNLSYAHMTDEEDEGSEKWNDTFKVTQPVRNTAEPPGQAIWIQGCILITQLHCYLGKELGLLTKQLDFYLH